MAEMPKDGSLVIVTTTDHRQIRGTLWKDDDDRVRIVAQGYSEWVRWGEVWACRVIEEGEG